MVLVTGGTGLLGSHLIQQLYLNGIKARALYRKNIPSFISAKAEWIKADILDVLSLEEVMQDITEVYHCAGHVSFNSSQKNKLYQVNVEGTANIVNACLNVNVKKLVHVSSVAVLGKSVTNTLIDEKAPWDNIEKNNSFYGKSKYYGEMEVWRGIGEGLNAVIVNPSIIIGRYGDWTKGSMAIFKNIYDGFPWYSEGTTGFVDADDVAKAMIMIMQSNITAERFIISAENKNYYDLFCMIAEGFGKSHPNKKVSPLLASIIWRLEKIKSWLTKNDPLITKETATTALARVQYDNSKLLNALPQFNYIPLKTSIEAICNFIQKQKY